jgi:hypothetical protein
MKSNGEMINLSVPCQKCDKKIDVELDLEKSIIIENDEKLKQIVKVNKDISLEIQPVTIASFFNDEYDVLNIIASSVSKVIFDNKVYMDFSREELIEKILGNMIKKDFSKVSKAIDSLVKLKLKFEYTCIHCKHKNIKETDKIVDFL